MSVNTVMVLTLSSCITLTGWLKRKEQLLLKFQNWQTRKHRDITKESQTEISLSFHFLIHIHYCDRKQGCNTVTQRHCIRICLYLQIFIAVSVRISIQSGHGLNWKRNSYILLLLFFPEMCSVSWVAEKHSESSDNATAIHAQESRKKNCHRGTSQLYVSVSTGLKNGADRAFPLGCYIAPWCSMSNSLKWCRGWLHVSQRKCMLAPPSQAGSFHMIGKS